MALIKFEDFSVKEEGNIIKVTKTEPQMYSDPNGMEYYKDDKENIYCQVDGVWHTCTEEGEPDCPIHAEIVVDELEPAKPTNEAAQKFTKTSSGMLPVGAKKTVVSDVKIKKDEWDKILTKINNMSSSKRSEIIKKLHGLGLM